MSEQMASQLDEQTFAEQVFRTLQAAIVCGEIAPGSKLSEPELARAYGISRGLLREALHRLEGKKLLQRSARLGARVVSLSLGELRELYQIREALEGMACAQAAQRMSAAELDALGQVLDAHANAECLRTGKGYYQDEGDYDFHYRIIQGSGNQTLARLLCDELYQLIRMYRTRYAATPNRPLQALKEHRAILDALLQGDAELAELLMRRHIHASWRNIERHSVAESFSNPPVRGPL